MSCFIEKFCFSSVIFYFCIVYKLFDTATYDKLHVRWFGIHKETIGLHLNSTGLSAYCRGDEQLIAHCQWHQPIYNMCSEFLALECDGWFYINYSKFFDFLRSVIFH